MNHQYNAGRSKRVLLSLLAAACLVVGSPVAAANAASGGAQKPVGATFGDCKNDNAGKHKGYVCPSDNGGGEETGTGTGSDIGDVIAM